MTRTAVSPCHRSSRSPSALLRCWMTAGSRGWVGREGVVEFHQASTANTGRQAHLEQLGRNLSDATQQRDVKLKYQVSSRSIGIRSVASDLGCGPSVCRSEAHWDSAESVHRTSALQPRMDRQQPQSPQPAHTRCANPPPRATGAFLTKAANDPKGLIASSALAIATSTTIAKPRT